MSEEVKKATKKKTTKATEENKEVKKVTKKKPSIKKEEVEKTIDPETKNEEPKESETKVETPVVSEEKPQQPAEESNNVKYCSRCGEKLREGALFCHKCGASTVAKKLVCASCGYELDKEDVFCPKCGTRVSSFEDKAVDFMYKSENWFKKTWKNIQKWAKDNWARFKALDKTTRIIIEAIAVVLLIIILVVGSVKGGKKITGTYSDDYTGYYSVTFQENKTYVVNTFGFPVSSGEYKVKGKKITMIDAQGVEYQGTIIDEKTIEFEFDGTKLTLYLQD